MQPEMKMETIAFLENTNSDSYQADENRTQIATNTIVKLLFSCQPLIKSEYLHFKTFNMVLRIL